jgi:predicted DNA-binding transcriptional regulator AlpA
MVDLHAERLLAALQVGGSPLAMSAMAPATLPSEHGPRKPRKRRIHEKAEEDRATIGVAGSLALATYEGERLLSTKAVVTITSLSRTEINRRIKVNKFPRPVAIGPHRVAFREIEIRNYVAKLLQGEPIASTEQAQARLCR